MFTNENKIEFCDMKPYLTDISICCGGGYLFDKQTPDGHELQCCGLSGTVYDSRLQDCVQSRVVIRKGKKIKRLEPCGIYKYNVNKQVS